MFNKPTLLFGKKSKWWTHMLYIDGMHDMIIGDRLVDYLPMGNVTPNKLYLGSQGYQQLQMVVGSELVQDSVIDGGTVLSYRAAPEPGVKRVSSVAVKVGGSGVQSAYFAYQQEGELFGGSLADIVAANYGDANAFSIPLFGEYPTWFYDRIGQTIPIYLSIIPPPHGTQVSAANDDFFAEEAVC